jgi:hypothetical protein
MIGVMIAVRRKTLGIAVLLVLGSLGVTGGMGIGKFNSLDARFDLAIVLIILFHGGLLSVEDECGRASCDVGEWVSQRGDQRRRESNFFMGKILGHDTLRHGGGRKPDFGVRPREGTERNGICYERVHCNQR